MSVFIVTIMLPLTLGLFKSNAASKLNFLREHTLLSFVSAARRYCKCALQVFFLLYYCIVFSLGDPP